MRGLTRKQSSTAGKVSNVCTNIRVQSIVSLWKGVAKVIAPVRFVLAQTVKCEVTFILFVKCKPEINCQ